MLFVLEGVLRSLKAWKKMEWGTWIGGLLRVTCTEWLSDELGLGSVFMGGFVYWEWGATHHVHVVLTGLVWPTGTGCYS